MTIEKIARDEHTCEHCGAWHMDHDYQHLAEVCLPKQIERLSAGVVAKDDAIMSMVINELRPLQNAVAYIKEILETQDWWHNPSHDLYPLRFVLEDASSQAPCVSDQSPQGQDAQRLDPKDESAAALAETPHLLPHLSASYRAGAEDMREACREKIKDLSRAEKRDARGDYRSAAFWDVFCELAKVPLPDPQPTPSQESRDV